MSLILPAKPDYAGIDVIVPTPDALFSGDFQIMIAPGRKGVGTEIQVSASR